MKSPTTPLVPTRYRSKPTPGNSETARANPAETALDPHVGHNPRQVGRNRRQPRDAPDHDRRCAAPTLVRRHAYGTEDANAQDQREKGQHPSPPQAVQFTRSRVVAQGNGRRTLAPRHLPARQCRRCRQTQAYRHRPTGTGLRAGRSNRSNGRSRTAEMERVMRFELTTITLAT